MSILCPFPLAQDFFMPIVDSLRRRYMFFMTAYFVQGAIGIIYEPLNYILKDYLRLSAGEAAGFIAWMTCPLLFKPFYGIITDFLSLGGHRRKPHLILAALVSAASFFGLSAQSHYRYLPLLALMALSILAMAFADVVCGGWLVEDGKVRQVTGPYQAIHVGSLYLSAVIVGVGGGWLTSHISFAGIFFLAGLLPLGVVLFAFFVREQVPDETSHPQGALFREFILTKPFLFLCLTILLWNFYPFLGTVQFYYQSNVLHLSPQWIGSVTTIGALAGLAGSAIFWKFCRGENARLWVSRGPWVMALVSLSYLFYRGPYSVIGIEILFGFGTVFFRLALLDLLARTCPKGIEATAYALFLAFFDTAMYTSNALGGKVFDFLRHVLTASPHGDYLSVMALILMGSFCTFMCQWTLKLSRTATS